MKTCPNCGEQYPDTKKFCRTDGGKLVEIPVAKTEMPPERFQPTGTKPISSLVAESPVGRVLAGHYQIVSLIGKSGRSEVYRGEHIVSHQPVVFKIFDSRMSQIPDQVSKYLTDVEKLSQLKHPNVVQIFDFGVLENGSLFLVREYVEGTLISELFKQGGCLSLERTLHLLDQISQALESASRLHIFHQDLTPLNVFSLSQGEVKVMGFEDIAFIISDSVPYPVGNSHYLSPEQIRSSNGAVGDAYTNVYALGILTFELLTGSHPFDPQPFLAVKQKIAGPPPQIRRLKPEILPEVDAVVQKALDPEPAKRFQTVSEFIFALKQAGRAPTAQLLPISQPLTPGFGSKLIKARQILEREEWNDEQLIQTDPLESKPESNEPTVCGPTYIANQEILTEEMKATLPATDLAQLDGPFQMSSPPSLNGPPTWRQNILPTITPQTIPPSSKPPIELMGQRETPPPLPPAFPPQSAPMMSGPAFYQVHTFPKGMDLPYQPQLEPIPRTKEPLQVTQDSQIRKAILLVAIGTCLGLLIGLALGFLFTGSLVGAVMVGVILAAFGLGVSAFFGLK